jgi:oligopeptide/dipeptide ABC transporter ATP-binding protein
MSAAAETVLEVEHLSVQYQGVGVANHAVNDISFHVNRGEVVGLVGESGSGKSTAVLATLGLVRNGGSIAGGQVRLGGRELLGLSDEEWQKVRGDQIGLVMQNPRGALNPVMRVGEQLSTVYRAHRDATAEEARVRALELLKMVGINDPERRLQAFPHELSGGMAQRVLIAMSFACSPGLLLADEPTSGLDVTVQAQVLDDLRRAAQDVGSSLLLVTQDLGIVANYCDRVYLMHAGEIVEHATTERFFAAPSHPASVALLSAQRGSTEEHLRLHGFPVDARRLPTGCWLQSRCPFASAEAGCTSEHPALEVVAGDHVSRCHRIAAVREEVDRHLAASERIALSATATTEGAA